jgi:hypothetical protein
MRQKKSQSREARQEEESMKKSEFVIAGGGLAAARAIKLIAEHAPMDALERELVGGRSR